MEVKGLKSSSRNSDHREVFIERRKTPGMTRLAGEQHQRDKRKGDFAARKNVGMSREPVVIEPEA